MNENDALAVIAGVWLIVSLTRLGLSHQRAKATAAAKAAKEVKTS